MKTALWHLSLVLIACLVLNSSTVAAGVLPARDALRPAPQGAAAGGYGPQLFLLVAGPDQRDLLAGLPLAVHARLAESFSPQPAAGAAGTRYLASGSAAARAQAAAAGLAVRLLDEDTAGKAYYLVDAAAPASALATAAGAVVYADAAQLVLALPTAEEPARVVELADRGLRLTRVETGSYALAERGAAAALAPRPAAAADPFIASLLPLVTTGSLSDFIADLSGERPVNIAGRVVTFNTRYFFGSRTRDVEDYLYQYYARLGLPVAYTNWTYGNYSGRNVVAEMRGTVHPERVWLIGGHFDSNSNDPYVSAPGADDNASGVAATMALAAVVARYQFADTVRFVNFSAEELGEWGSKRYAAALNQAGVQVMGYIDLDMIGYDGNHDRVVEAHTGTGLGSINLGQALASANSRYGQGLTLEIKEASASNFSDHSSFWYYGYPAVLAIENFYADAIPADHNPWYHNTGDLLSRVDLDYVARYARTALATLAEAAGLQAPVSRRTCRELVGNGDFESDAAWIFTPTATTAGYTTQLAHGGVRSARFGLLPGVQPAGLQPGSRETNLRGEVAAEGASYSSGYQAINLPADADYITLRFWYVPRTLATADDFQRILLLRADDYSTVATVMQELADSESWRPRNFDLTAYRGQNLVLYFETYNHDTASGAPTWMYLDDVSVQSCTGPALVPVMSLPRLDR